MHSWQVYLSSPQPPSSRHPELFVYDEDDKYDELKWKIFDHDSQPYMWGYRVRHLRIDQIDINQLKVNKIDDDSNDFRQLKILVLRPVTEQVINQFYEVSIRSLPY